MIRFHQDNVKALFIHIPKTGGSTIANILQEIFIAERANIINGTHSGHTYKAFIKDVNKQKTFAFIRDPITWHESAYKMIRDIRPFIKDYRKSGFDPIGVLGYFYDPDFQTFINNILRFCPDFYSEMLTRYLGEDKIEVDYLGATERLNQDLVKILLKLGFKGFDRERVLKWKRLQERNGDQKWGSGQADKIIKANQKYYNLWMKISKP